MEEYQVRVTYERRNIKQYIDLNITAYSKGHATQIARKIVLEQILNLEVEVMREPRKKVIWV